jgi:hypothetical protein
MIKSITKCLLAALSCCGLIQGQSFGQDVSMTITNQADYDIVVKSIVNNFETLSFDIKDVATVAKGTNDQKITVPAGANLRIYQSGVTDMKDSLGTTTGVEGAKIILRKPGFEFSIPSLYCDLINYSEPGYSIEVGFSVDVTVEWTGDKTSTTKKWGDETPAGDNRTDFDYALVDVAEKNTAPNLITQTFNVPKDQLGSATVTVKIYDAYEDDDGNNDLLTVQSGNNTHKNIPTKPVTKSIKMSEPDTQSVTLTYKIENVKTFEVIGGQ